MLRLAEEIALAESVVEAAEGWSEHEGIEFDDGMLLLWDESVASAKWRRVKAARTKLVESTCARVESQ